MQRSCPRPPALCVSSLGRRQALQPPPERAVRVKGCPRPCGRFVASRPQRGTSGTGPQAGRGAHAGVPFPGLSARRAGHRRAGARAELASCFAVTSSGHKPRSQHFSKTVKEKALMPEAAFSGACSLLRLLPGGWAHGQRAPPSTGDPGRGGGRGGRRGGSSRRHTSARDHSPSVLCVGS